MRSLIIHAQFSFKIVHGLVYFFAVSVFKATLIYICAGWCCMFMQKVFFLQDEINFYGFSHVFNFGASFIKKGRTICHKMSVRSFFKKCVCRFHENIVRSSYNRINAFHKQRLIFLYALIQDPT